MCFASHVNTVIFSNEEVDAKKKKFKSVFFLKKGCKKPNMKQNP